MRERYDESTGDIHMLLTREEAISLERSKEVTPVLTEKEGGIFLINRDSGRYIEMHYWPRARSGKPNGLILSNEAYEDLRRNNECGTRYGLSSSSKIRIIVDDELATPISSNPPCNR